MTVATLLTPFPTTSYNVFLSTHSYKVLATRKERGGLKTPQREICNISGV